MHGLKNYYCYDKNGRPFMVVHAERVEKIPDDFFEEIRFYYAFFISTKVILTCCSEISIIEKE